MFEVPNWEDTPSINISFTALSTKIKSKNKGKKTNITEKPKQPSLAIPKFKAKLKAKSKLKVIKGLPNKNLTKPFASKINQLENNINQNQNIGVSNKKKKISKDLQNYNTYSDDDINIKNYDTDKLDELILEVKKQRFNSYKNNDNEDALWQENPEAATNQDNHSTITDNGLHKNFVEVENEYKNKKDDIKLTSPKKRVKTKVNHNTNIQENPFQDRHEKNMNKDILPDNTSKLKQNSVKVKDLIVNHKDISNDVKNGCSNEKLHKLQKIYNKRKLNTLLQKEPQRSSINIKGDKLRERMLERLKAAKFRYLNEKLYTSSGNDAQKLFQTDPAAFQTYHEGYQQQVKKWPVKPLDVIVQRIQKMPKSHKIADMGCGEAELSSRVAQPVRSFDLVATAPGVEACDMAHTPLLSSSMDVAVYCLALMGTDLTQYLVEANRVLKVGGHLLIAEVESRFSKVENFNRDVQKLGFSLKKMDNTHEVFYFMEFTKAREAPTKKGKLPILTLKPCIYKKR